jgi:hypothetical protein
MEKQEKKQEEKADPKTEQKIIEVPVFLTDDDIKKMTYLSYLALQDLRALNNDIKSELNEIHKLALE